MRGDRGDTQARAEFETRSIRQQVHSVGWEHRELLRRPAAGQLVGG
jgi:hypothetical protein